MYLETLIICINTHGIVPNIDPQYSNFHPEIMIQSRFLMDNPEERDKIFALDVKTLRC